MGVMRLPLPILAAFCLTFAACVPAASGNAPRTALEVPGGPTLDIAATPLRAAPATLERAFGLFYTSSPDRLGPALALTLAEPNALEAAFLRQNTTVQSRWTYADTRLFTWPLGATGRVVAVVQGQTAIVRVHRSDVNPPFDGRVIAKRLAEGLKPTPYLDAAETARRLEYVLSGPQAPGFEYSLRRPAIGNPGIFDQFDFRVPGLDARFVATESFTLPGEVGAALRLPAAGTAVRLVTPPARIAGEPAFGLEVPVLIGNCSLEGLSDREASYVCSRGGQDRNVTVAVKRQ